MNNRLTAEVREEDDAVGVNDFNAYLYICSFPTSPLPFTTFEHWHTHTHRSPSLSVCWYDAGGKQFFSACPERTVTLVAWSQNPPPQHHRALLKKDWKGNLQKPRKQNSSTSPSNIAVKSSRPIPTVRSTHRWEIAEEMGYEIRPLNIQF